MLSKKEYINFLEEYVIEHGNTIFDVNWRPRFRSTVTLSLKKRSLLEVMALNIKHVRSDIKNGIYIGEHDVMADKYRIEFLELVYVTLKSKNI